MRRWLAVSLVGFTAVALVSRDGYVARAPALVKKTLEYRGKHARRLAELLQLPVSETASATFELSLWKELIAMPEREQALLDAMGITHYTQSGPIRLLPPDLDWHASSRVWNTVTWNPGAESLRIEGYVEDWNTAYPRGDGPRYTFSSPTFADDEIERLPGWKPLYSRLRSEPTKSSDRAEVRALEIALPGGEHAVVSHSRFQTWDRDNQPVERSLISVAVGSTPRRPSGGCD